MSCTTHCLRRALHEGWFHVPRVRCLYGAEEGLVEEATWNLNSRDTLRCASHPRADDMARGDAPRGDVSLARLCV